MAIDIRQTADVAIQRKTCDRPRSARYTALGAIRAGLSRVTSSGQYSPEIDGLRFAAITGVVFFHLRGFIESRTGQSTSNPVTWLFGQGGLGVPLFFVISGFILGLPFARHYLAAAKPVILRRYLVRRVTRLEPPYMIQLGVSTVVLAAAFLAGLVPHLHLAGLLDIAKHALASLFYVHNIVYGDLNPVNWVLWSLEIEVQFYLAMPLFALLYRAPSNLVRTTRWFLLIAAFGILNCTAASQSWRFQHSLIGNAQYFFAGILLADVYVTRTISQRRPRIVWDLIALPAWLCIPILGALPYRNLLLPIAVLVAYSGALWGLILNRLFSQPWLATIGGMCYTIYLYHYLIILALGPLTLKLPRTGAVWFDHSVQYLVLSGAILGLCGIVFALFERPFMVPGWHKQIAQLAKKWWTGTFTSADTARSRPHDPCGAAPERIPQQVAP